MTKLTYAGTVLAAALSGGVGVCAVPANAASSYKLVYSFQGASGDGALPQADLLNVGSTLYGTTYSGGPYCKGGEYRGCGTVFSVSATSGAELVLHSFNHGRGPSLPMAGLIKVGDKFYGTSLWGGAGGCNDGAGCGTVFSVDPATGAVKVVYSFQGVNDGAEPSSALINFHGTLFGTTSMGGGTGCRPIGCGTVFSLDPKTGVETVLHSFQEGSDGISPQAGVVKVGARLFGTSFGGGDGGCNDGEGCGTVFSVNLKTGVEKVVHSFQGGSDGAIPAASLINAGGTLYGTTVEGGSGSSGTVFSVNPATGAEMVVHAFSGSGDGALPYTDLIEVAGTLFGTTLAGGVGNGTVFSVDLTTGTESVAYAFLGGNDGSRPLSGLTNVGGVLYGTTEVGGGSGCEGGCGTVFAITP